jgi:peptidoglycan hydrolase CwlO-like protein
MIGQQLHEIIAALFGDNRHMAQRSNRDLAELNLRLLALIHTTMEKMMADLSRLQADVAAQKTVIDSAVALLQSLAGQVRATAGDPDSVEALAASLEANSKALADAVAANTVVGPATAAPQPAPVSSDASPSAPASDAPQAAPIADAPAAS